MRIVVIANKWWECEATLTGMLNTNAFPASLLDGTVSSPWYNSLSSPRSLGNGRLPSGKPSYLFL